MSLERFKFRRIIGNRQVLVAEESREREGDEVIKGWVGVNATGGGVLPQPFRDGFAPPSCETLRQPGPSVALLLHPVRAVLRDPTGGADEADVAADAAAVPAFDPCHDDERVIALPPSPEPGAASSSSGSWTKQELQSFLSKAMEKGKLDPGYAVLKQYAERGALFRGKTVVLATLDVAARDEHDSWV